MDDRSRELQDVSHYRVCVWCQDVSIIPEVLHLTVDDRRFRIQTMLDSWEEAVPIFLGENLDHHLGLDSAEAQDEFIRQTGFTDISAADKQHLPGPARGSCLQAGLEQHHSHLALDPHSPPTAIFIPLRLQTHPTCCLRRP